MSLNIQPKNVYTMSLIKIKILYWLKKQSQGQVIIYVEGREGKKGAGVKAISYWLEERLTFGQKQG